MFAKKSVKLAVCTVSFGLGRILAFLHQLWQYARNSDSFSTMSSDLRCRQTSTQVADHGPETDFAGNKEGELHAY